MLNEEVDSSPLTEREAQLIEKTMLLKAALASTLYYIESRLQPVLPPELKAHQRLLEEIKPEALIPLNAPRDFLDAVTAMARFLNLTSSAQVFEQFGVTGFADWTILMTLAVEPEGMTERQLFRMIRMNQKRVRRITERLAQEGHLRLVERNNAPLISITTTGEQRLKAINARLEPLLSLFSQRNRLEFFRVGKRVRTLARMYDRAPPEKKAGQPRAEPQ